ncbi:hypothetical protein A3K72_00615 [Candidatus Woesearchaeota archaeon RBG_13_36_6]|nr:MAG: hypothetical protein A3K72_00615 [Candidatus Woesearchaeota archaeon RBG_13_36_6]
MFRKLPRYLSFPEQIYVDHEIAFRNLIRVCNGVKPCSTTMYVFPTRESLIVDKVLFELDNEISPERPYRDASKLKTFAEKHNIPCTIIFSGRKGFHVYHWIEPISVVTEEEKLSVKNLLYSYQVSLRDYLKIVSLDKQIIGQIRHPIRMPTTAYIDMKGNKNGRFCRYIPAAEFDKGLRHIISMAKEPGHMPPEETSALSIQKISELIPQYQYQKRYHKISNLPLDLQGGIKTPCVQGLGLPCMIEALEDSNPPRETRIEIAAWLKFLGYRDIAIVSFFKEVNWMNFDYDKTVANVRCIKARLPRCMYLGEEYGSINCENCSLKKRRQV